MPRSKPDMNKATKYNPDFALSTMWRVRRSGVPEIALRYVQEDIQSFVDTLIEDGEQYKVVFKGEENVTGYTMLDKPVIYISYGPVKDEHIEDDTRLDVVAGIGVHEAGHSHFKKIRGQSYNGPIANILEDMWIDYNVSERAPVLGGYIDRCRSYYTGDSWEHIEKRFASDRPFGKGEIQYLWMNIVLYGQKDIWKLVNARTAPDRKEMEKALTALIRLGISAIDDLDKDAVTYTRIVQGAEAILDGYARRVQEQEEESQQGGNPGQGQSQGSQTPPTGQGRTKSGDDSSESRGGSAGAPKPQDRQEDKSEQGSSDGDQDDVSQDEDGDDQETDQGDGSSGETEEGGYDEDNSHREGDGEDEEEENSDRETDEDDLDGDDPFGPDLKGIGGSGGQGSGHGLFDDDDDWDEGETHGVINKQDGIAREMPPLPENDDELIPETCADHFLEEMPADLASLVWEAAEQEAEDVSDVAGEPNFIMRKPPLGDPILVASKVADELRESFETRRVVNTLNYPFQEAGRLCRRTLPVMVALPEHRDIFEDQVNEDDIDCAVGMLVDASGSIGSGYSFNSRTGQYDTTRGQWEMIMETCQVMIDAFQDGDLDLMIMAYTTNVVWRLYEPGWDSIRIGDVAPSAGTPSVPAMKVLHNEMKKKCQHRRDKMIIHLTDGSPNEGGGIGDMRALTRKIEAEGTKVIGLGAGVPDRALNTQYDRYFSIDSFEEVPSKLRKILERF